MMKKLKFIRANKTKFGGAEVYLSRLSNTLKLKNIEHAVNYSNIPKFLPSWLRVILFNLKVCKEKRDDLYFSLERITCPDIYRAGDGVHKVFLEIEKKSKFNPLHFVYLYLEKKCFTNSRVIIANSNMVKNDILKSYEVIPEKIKVIHNGIKLYPQNLKVAMEKLKKEFTISEEDKIILYVGSGFKRKGVKEFLEIFSKLKDKEVKAFIVGKEKKMSYYKSLAKNLDISNRIVFTGAREDVREFYTVSDIFLFPTRYEPFSNVVLEAMSYSNAVITTRYNGASEILDDEFIMDDSIDYSIIEKIDDLLEDTEKLKIVKERNLQIVQNFSIERNVQETLKVINEVLNENLH